MRGRAAVRFLYGDMTGSPVPKMLAASKLCPNRRIDCCAARGRWHHDRLIAIAFGASCRAGTDQPAIATRRSFCRGWDSLVGTIGAGDPAHTFKHGAFEITVLSDGNLILPTPVLAIGTDRKQLDAALADAGQSEDRVEPPCNVTLVRTASEFILIDTGAGPHSCRPPANCWPIAGGGIARDSVTKVVFKHAHPDPIWGTHDEFDDAPNFHYATYVITENERNFWRGSDVAAKMPEHRQSLIPGAKRNLSQIKDRFETIEPGTDIVLGGRTIDTAATSQSRLSAATTRCWSLVTASPIQRSRLPIPIGSPMQIMMRIAPSPRASRCWIASPRIAAGSSVITGRFPRSAESSARRWSMRLWAVGERHGPDWRTRKGYVGASRPHDDIRLSRTRLAGLRRRLRRRAAAGLSDGARVRRLRDRHRRDTRAVRLGADDARHRPLGARVDQRRC